MAVRYRVLLTLVVVAGAATLPASAESLPDLLRRVLVDSEKIKAGEADLSAAGKRVKEARGNWFPKLDTTLNTGFEHQMKPSAGQTAPTAKDSSLPTRAGELKLTQPIWDFGATNAQIDTAHLAEDEAGLKLDTTRQDVLLDGIKAYIGLIKAHEELKFARESVDNIRKQTGLEEAKVQRGSGLPADVLQAKRQLAGAESKRVRAEGILVKSLNAYRRSFYATPAKLAELVMPGLPNEPLPNNMAEAVEQALAASPEVKLANTDLAKAQAKQRERFARNWAPSLNLTGSAKWKEDSAGTPGYKRELLGLVELTYPFNLGLSALDNHQAAILDVEAAGRRLADRRHTVEEKVRNAWEAIETARKNADFLKDQAILSAEFLDLARKERQLGNRSLLDVLAGETALLDANREAASADKDIVLAAYGVLAAIGNLDFDDVN